MRLWRDLREYALLVLRDWTSVMTGALSVVLTALGATVHYLPGWPFWIVAALCLVLVGFRVWRGERHAHEKLTADLTARAVDPADADRARKLLAREELAVLYAQATSPPSPEWKARVEAALSKHLSVGHVVRFRQHADASPQWIMEEFLKELASP